VVCTGLTFHTTICYVWPSPGPNGGFYPDNSTGCLRTCTPDPMTQEPTSPQEGGPACVALCLMKLRCLSGTVFRLSCARSFVEAKARRPLAQPNHGKELKQ